MKQLLTWFVVLPSMLAVILAWSAVDESIAQLRLDHAALRAAQDDYRSQRELNRLSGTEAADYAAYIARLQRRVYEDCQGVLALGGSYPDDLPCLTGAPTQTGSADIVMQAERTAEEQVAALDAMLMAGLGEYDERLLREQERIKAAAPNTNSDTGDGSGSDGGGADGGGEGEDGTEGDAGDQGRNSGGVAGNNQRTGTTGGQRQGGPVDSSQGSGDAGNDSDQPADIGDGSDDDVVARQLREAAEKETDPELKAKLWEEYRRYTRGTN
ncbi:MAG: hypothetical protein QNK19_10200 [Xanthomonadales bacterium]|nr:hypothetical protein [Xanthomonadales bacterium]